MNKYLADVNTATIDPNTVVLFETDSGKGPGSRLLIYYSEHRDDFKLDQTNPNHRILVRGPSLDKNRWNQCGGPELLTASHHGGEGANILFADGHVEFVHVKDFPTLHWKP
jgi:prepilin-type processing-associated H-X9-DG protein